MSNTERLRESMAFADLPMPVIQRKQEIHYKSLLIVGEEAVKQAEAVLREHGIRFIKLRGRLLVKRPQAN
jgi:hypothetical protein